MKELIKMSIDVEIEIDVEEVTEDDLARFKKQMGYDLFDKDGKITKEAFEKEKEIYIIEIRNELESLEYKVKDIYNFEVDFEK